MIGLIAAAAFVLGCVAGWWFTRDALEQRIVDAERIASVSTASAETMAAVVGAAADRSLIAAEKIGDIDPKIIALTAAQNAQVSGIEKLAELVLANTRAVQIITAELGAAGILRPQGTPIDRRQVGEDDNPPPLDPGGIRALDVLSTMR